MARIHLVYGGCSVSMCLFVPLSLLLLPPGPNWDTWNQGYSQDVGDDAYAPAKQRTVKSGPPGSNAGPARDSPHGSQWKWPLAPPWWPLNGISSLTVLSIPLFSSTQGSMWSHHALGIESEDPRSRSDSCTCRL